MENPQAEMLAARWQHWRAVVRSAEPGALIAEVPAEHLLGVLGDARGSEGPGFRSLVDLTAIDHGVDASGSRFVLVYMLSQPGSGASLRVHVALGSGLEMDSIVSLWPSANWLEREVFDLFGIAFRGHPDLHRLLLPRDFEGAPLRKDYPRQPNLPLPKEVAS
jgi:NADH:ubiquinone oxidoreductase subunit C